jgi:DNA ligase-1
MLSVVNQNNIREYPVLYHLDENGNTRIWWIEQATEKYRANSGIKGGQIVTSEWTICIPKNVGKKNYRSEENQAVSEIDAEYKKKLERKYHLNEGDIIKRFHYFQPMLCDKFDSFEAGTLVFTQPKLDGARCIAKADGLWSRTGKKYVSCPHIERILAPVFEKYPNIVLDGEFYNHNLKNDFNKIMSLIRKTKLKEEELEESGRLVQYHVYDCYDETNPHLVFTDRSIILQNILIQLACPDIIVNVNTDAAYTRDRLDTLYTYYLTEGYEGQIIRYDTPYEQKRSKNILKRKEFIDEEFDVVGVEEGLGNWSGYAKAITCKTKDGKIFGAGVRGDQDYCKSLLNGELPTVATIRYQNLTPDGIPRFPICLNVFYGVRDI